MAEVKLNKRGRIGFAHGNGAYEEKIKALMAKGLSRELSETIVYSGLREQAYDVADKANGGTVKTITYKPTGRKPEGIMRVASERGDREYLTMMLSRYFTPRELYYKTLKELEQLLQIHLTESGGLI